jgi:hypothetical protein
MASPRLALMIFMRYPQPGRVKTRLAQSIGTGAARDVYMRLLRRTLGVAADWACRRRDVDLLLFHQPPAMAGRIAREYPGPWRLVGQRGDHLGEQMAAAFTDARALGYDAAVLIGSDIADLAGADLTAACDAVVMGQAALGPAADGGFYLIALARPCPEAFAFSAWGSGDILGRTFACLRAAGFSVALLAERHDIDRPEDLCHLAGRYFRDRLSVIVPTLEPLEAHESLLAALDGQLWPGDEIVVARGLGKIPAARETGLPPPGHGAGTFHALVAGSRANGVRRPDGGLTPRVPFTGSADSGDAAGGLRAGGTALRVTVSAPGRGRQLNAGARAARGELLWFLHADSVPPDNFGHHVRGLAEDTTTALGCFRLAFRPRNRALDGIAAWANWRSRWFALPYGDQGLCCRREVYEAIGGFRRLYLMEDVEFVRAARRLGKVRVLPETIATSSAAYLRGGILRTSLRHHRVMLLYHLGVPDGRLYAHYYRST